MHSYLWAVLASLRILQVHSRRRIGVIYSVETGYAGLASVIASRLLRVPLIVHSHGQRSELLRKIRVSMRDWRTFPYWALEKAVDHFVVVRAFRLVAVNDDVSRFLQGLGAQQKRILVAPSAVEPQREVVADDGTPRWRCGLPPHSFVVGYLGRLERQKGVDILLTAFADFQSKSKRPTVLLIVGDGPDRGNILRLVRQGRINGVRFLGYQDEVRTFFSSLDVFVLPSFHEGSPISLLEAMASGCPIIASKLSSVVRVAGDSVIYFPPGDSESLSELLSMLELHPGLRKELAAKGKERSKDFSIDTILPKILDFCLGQKWVSIGS